MSDKPLLNEVAVEEGQSPWDLAVGKPHNPNGLSDSEVETIREQWGYNEMEEKKRNRCLEFLKHFWGPMPIMIWIAILIELIQLDWMDFAVLCALQAINGLVGWYEESKASDAIEALRKNLAPKCNVKRSGEWINTESRLLVPGDLVKLTLGGLIPADCEVLDGKLIQVDTSQMTGESLPVTMRKGDKAPMGCCVKSGEVEAVVRVTGKNTELGKIISTIANTNDVGHFELIIYSITLFLLAVSLILVSFIMAVLLLNDFGILKTLGICVVLLVASIPIAMQVVCTSTMALGSRALAEKQAIVSRLASIEELAGMDMLCSDKTGTLTQNIMTIESKLPWGETSEQQLLMFALLATEWTQNAKDAIDTMLFKCKKEVQADLDRHTSLDYTPFDPAVKTTESYVKENSKPDAPFKVKKGAPHIVAACCHNHAEIKADVDAQVLSFAERGIRCLGIASTDEEGRWVFRGNLTFSDPPRPDTKDVIARAGELGIQVKMITGDHVAIAKETCRVIGMGTQILTTKDIPASEADTLGDRFGELVESCDGFAGVHPEHKFQIVQVLKNRGWLTGMTGDGVNDAPALKKANVGIAVEGATDAAQGASAIVLTSPGLSVIVEAIDLARKIFQRMKNYVIYRIACTLQLLVFFFLATMCVDPQAVMGSAGFKTTGQEDHDEIPRYFALPVMAMVLITILNDGTIISIAYDYVEAGKVPEKWNLPIVCSIAALLGGVACASSILMLYMCLYTSHEDSILRKHFNVPQLSYMQIQCALYLKVSISDFLTVFAARTHGFFFSRRPGVLLACAAVFATSTSTLLSWLWPFHDMEPIPGPLVGIMWLYCLAWFLLQDLAKVLAYTAVNHSTFSLGGESLETKERKKKLAQRASLRVQKGSVKRGGTNQGSEQPTLNVQDVLARINALEGELQTLKKVAAEAK